ASNVCETRRSRRNTTYSLISLSRRQKEKRVYRVKQENQTMMTRRRLLDHAAVAIGAAAISPSMMFAARGETFEFSHTDAEWRKLLTPDQFAVLRKSATERPYTSALLHEERRGNFGCVGCDLDLFSSTTKFDSRTGWPSFWAPLDKAIGTTRDTSFGM